MSGNVLESRVPDRESDDFAPLVRRHLRTGWWLILVFLTLGIALETLHGFKVPWYVDASSETRRTLWRLAHAHGTLLGLLHLAFAATLPLAPGLVAPRRRVASRCLIAASVLLPGGFFLGGTITHGGDPGLGVLAVPVGALCLLAAVAIVALGTTRSTG